MNIVTLTYSKSFGLQVVKYLESKNIALQVNGGNVEGKVKTGKSVVFFTETKRQHQFDTGFKVMEILVGPAIILENFNINIGKKAEYRPTNNK